MAENWYALLIAIKRSVTVEQAFDMFEKGKLGKKNKLITDKDIEDMRAMKKQGFTYKEIGEIYCTTKDSVCHRLQYAKKKMEMIV